MKSKFLLSSLTLLLFALLGGGSIDPDALGATFVTIIVIVVIVVIAAGIAAMVQSHNKNKLCLDTILKCYP